MTKPRPDCSAVAAAAIVTFAAGWGNPTEQSPFCRRNGGQIDTFKMMTTETTAFRALRRLFLRVQLRCNPRT
jgi:hypothetical protein